MRIGSVEFEKKGRIAVITLDEPTKLNALSADIRKGVLESLAMIDADDEIRVGIVLKVVPHDKLMDEAFAFAGRLAAQPRLAIAMAKSFYNRGLGGDEMRYAMDAFPFLFMHEDAREGITAFREKRKPKFKD